MKLKSKGKGHTFKSSVYARKKERKKGGEKIGSNSLHNHVLVERSMNINNEFLELKKTINK